MNKQTKRVPHGTPILTEKDNKYDKLVNYTVCLTVIKGKDTNKAEKGSKSCWVCRFRWSGTG